MILAAISFGVMAACVKWAAARLPSMEIVFFRSAIASLGVAWLLWKNKISWFGKRPSIMLLRGISGFGALALHFYAISKLDLGTAVMLNYTAPIFVMIFAHAFLGEKTSGPVKISIAFSFFGLYLLASPQWEAKLVPILLGLCSGILAALAYVFIRWSDEGESPYTIIFYFTGISTLGSLPLLKLGFLWPSSIEWLVLAGVTGGAFLGQIWLTKAIRSAPVSLVLPFGYLTPILSSIAGWLFWRESLGPGAMMGGAIIIASGVVIYLLKGKPDLAQIEE